MINENSAEALIKKMVGFKTLFQSAFTLHGTEKIPEGDGLQSTGTELSSWSHDFANKEDKKTLADFTAGIKDLLVPQKEGGASKSLAPVLETKEVNENEIVDLTERNSSFASIAKHLWSLHLENDMEVFQYLLSLALQADKTRAEAGRQQLKSFLEEHPALSLYLSTQLDKLQPVKEHYDQYLQKVEKLKNKQLQISDYSWIVAKSKLIEDYSETLKDLTQKSKKAPDIEERMKLRAEYRRVLNLQEKLIKSLIKSEIEWLKSKNYWYPRDDAAVEGLMSKNKVKEAQDYVLDHFGLGILNENAENIEKNRIRLLSQYSEAVSLLDKVQKNKKLGIKDDKLIEQCDFVNNHYNNGVVDHMQNKINWLNEAGAWTKADKIEAKKIMQAQFSDPKAYHNFRESLSERYNIAVKGVKVKLIPDVGLRMEGEQNPSVLFNASIAKPTQSRKDSPSSLPQVTPDSNEGQTVPKEGQLKQTQPREQPKL